MTAELGGRGKPVTDSRIATVWAHGVDHVVHLGMEPLPWPSGSQDQILDRGELACLPVSVWHRRIYVDPWGQEQVDCEVWRPRMALLAELWRCLAPDGVLVAEEPAAPPAWGQDPRHESPAWSVAAWQAMVGPAAPALRLGLPGEWIWIDHGWHQGLLRVELRKGPPRRD